MSAILLVIIFQNKIDRQDYKLLQIGMSPSITSLLRLHTLSRCFKTNLEGKPPV